MNPFEFPDNPAFLWYSKDWLEGTMEMMPDEKGVYADLLSHQHQKGSLPNDNRRLAKMAGISVKEFEKIWKEISKKFVLFHDRLINQKLYNLMIDQREKTIKNKIVGGFAAVLRKAELTRKERDEVKAEFDVYMVYDKVMAMDYLPDDQTVYHMVQEWYGQWSKSIGTGIGTGNNNKKKKVFKPPTLKEVQDYVEANNYLVDPEEFINSNIAKGWKVGKTKTPMVDWKAVVRTWHGNAKKSEKEKEQETQAPKTVVSKYHNLKNYEFDNEPKEQ